MDRNFMDFNTTFPAMTMCLHGLLNKTRANLFIDKKWANVSSEKKSFYQAFLQTIANVSYENLENFQTFANDSSIPRDGYYQILQEISPKFPGELEGLKPDLELAMTDRGNCYTVNSALRNNQHDRRHTEHSVDYPVLRDTIKMRHESGLVSFLVAGLNSTATFYPHSPIELSDVTIPGELVLPAHLYEAFYKATELVAAPDVAELDVDQRQCRYPHESDLAVNPVYSYSHCRLQCRMQLAVSLCGCSPYFYPLVDGFTECAIDGLLCLSKHKDSIKFLVDLETNRPVKSCKCMSTCSLVTYTLAKKLESPWTQGSQFAWQIPRPPRTQLKRRVLYGPTELLVSFGGTVGLFLGCSLLSGAEVIYFFTLRLGWQLSRCRSKNT